ncbi:hypothetical protein KJ780_04940 [Candidatus Micrarchaeota archaeon]|nr:hypothetical protein [Candidatus Micrarchaeota archaeon]
MNLSIFLKCTAVGVALALLSFAFIGDDLLFLAKGLALVLGISIVIAIAYPHLRGVRRGDRVFLIKGGRSLLGFWKSGFALQDAQMHKEIRVRLDDGKEAVGVVESYEGLFSPSKVRIVYEEKLVE